MQVSLIVNFIFSEMKNKAQNKQSQQKQTLYFNLPHNLPIFKVTTNDYTAPKDQGHDNKKGTTLFKA